MKSMEPGMLLTGFVRNVMPYGVFVEFPCGLTGLAPKSVRLVTGLFPDFKERHFKLKLSLVLALPHPSELKAPVGRNFVMRIAGREVWDSPKSYILAHNCTVSINSEAKVLNCGNQIVVSQCSAMTKEPKLQNRHPQFTSPLHHQFS